MQCRHCGYALWNLTQPYCPECGQRFEVTSYWFEPGSVVFKCPYCGHRHEGRTARGLPFDAGRCHGCGQMLVVEQMAIEPVDPAHPVDPRSDDDVFAARRRRDPIRRRGLIAVAIAVAAVVAWLLIILLLQSR